MEQRGIGSNIRTSIGSVGMTSPGMKELQIVSQSILNIDIMDLTKSCVIVISDERARVADLPPYANTVIKAHKGIVTRVNWDEGEAF